MFMRGGPRKEDRLNRGAMLMTQDVAFVDDEVKLIDMYLRSVYHYEKIAVFFLVIN
jgi:hypothetical protein